MVNNCYFGVRTLLRSRTLSKNLKKLKYIWYCHNLSSYKKSKQTRRLNLKIFKRKLQKGEYMATAENHVEWRRQWRIRKFVTTCNDYVLLKECWSERDIDVSQACMPEKKYHD